MAKRAATKIIELETENLVLDIKGVFSSETDGKKTSDIRVVSAPVISLKINGEEVPDPQSGDIVYSVPLFFEEKDYLFEVRSKDASKAVRVDHESEEIRRSFSQTMDMKNVISGNINFGGDIGYSEFIFRIEGEQETRLRIEVFPSKMEYREDYRKMMDEISETVYLAAIDFIKKTYHGFDTDSGKESSQAVFFRIIEQIFGTFEKAMDRICDNPHHKLETEHPLLPYHKIKRSDRVTEKWIISHPGYPKAPAAIKQVTYNTTENRFTKYILKRTRSRLEKFGELYKNSKRGAPNARVLDSLEYMENTVNRYLNGTFLRYVDEYEHTSSMSLVFEMAPGYRELFKCYMILQSGLELHGEVFRISHRETSKFYEYWCFIKLVNIFKNKFELITDDIVKASRSGITVALSMDSKSEVEFLNPKNGEKYTLSYNSSVGDTETQTVPQKPDNVLAIRKAGSGFPYKYVFDAKYRIQTVNDEFYPWQVPGPKAEDINTMHRYRDAIVYENPELDGFEFRKTMFGAYVLFPYSGDEDLFKEHHFYRSIDKVNIGALPFLPGKTKLAEELLQQLIDESAENVFRKVSLPMGVERKLARQDWTVKDVLVGLTRKNNGQYDFCLKNNCYWIPAKKMPRLKSGTLKYLVLIGPENRIEKYGEIDRTNTKEVPREQVPFPMTDNNPQEAYWYFKIKSWKKLPGAVKAGNYYGKYPQFTNRFLLENCNQLWQLFEIGDETEYRLWYLLEMVSEDIFKDGEYEITESFKLWAHLNNDGKKDIVFLKDGAEVCSFTADTYKRYRLDKFKKLRDELRKEE